MLKKLLETLKKLLRILKKVVIVSIIVFISLILLIILLYPGFIAPRVDDYLTNQVQHILENQLKREVSIEKIHLSFPNPQVTISNIAIARYQNLSEGTFLAAKLVKAKVLLRSVFSGNILVDDIVLDTPDIWIEFDEQGASNLPALGEGEQEEKPEEKKPGLASRIIEKLYFPDIRLVNGKVYFAHKQIPLTVSVQRVNTTTSLMLKGLQIQGNISLEGGAFELQDRGTIATTVAGDFKLDGKSLSLASFYIQANHSDVTVNGTISDVTLSHFDLAVLASVDLEEIDRFSQINQNLSGTAKFDGTVTGPVSDIAVAGHFTCDEGTAGGLHFANVSTEIKYQTKWVFVENLDANLFNGNVKGNAKLSFADPPQYTASVAFENLTLESINTLIDTPIEVNGHLSGKAEVQADSFDFEDLILHSALEIRDVNAYGVKIPKAQAQVDIEKQILAIKNLDAEVFQGTTKGEGTLALYDNFVYQAALDLQSVNLETIMALIPEPLDVSGQMSGRIVAQGSHFDLEHLQLTADLQAQNVDAYDIKAETLEALTRIQNSILHVEKLSSQLFEGNVTGQGKLVLAGNTLPQFDAQATLKDVSAQAFIRQFAPQVSQNGIALAGKISGDVGLTGKSFNLQDITGTAKLISKGDVGVSHFEGQKEGTVPLPFDLSFNCSLKDSIVSISKLDVDSDPLQLNISGTVEVFTPALNLTYQIASKDIHTLLQQVLPFIPEIEKDFPLYQFSGNITQLSGTIQGPVSQVQIQAKGHFTDADFVWISPQEALVDVTYQGNILRINQAKAMYNSADIEVHGTIDLKEPAAPRLELPVSVKAGNVNDYLLLVKQDYPIEGALQPIQTTITGTPEDLRGKFVVNVMKATVWDQYFDNVISDLELATNRIVFHSLTVRKNGGRIDMKGFLGFDLSYQADFTVKAVNFRNIDAFKTITQYQGQVDATINVEGTLQHPKGKAALVFNQLKYNGKPIEDVTCDVIMEHQTIRATLVTFHKKFIASMELALDATLSYRLEMLMEHAAVEQILALAVNVEGISGLVTGKITSEGSLQDIQQLSATIKLSALQLDIFGQEMQNSKEVDVVVTPQKFTVNSLELKGKELGVFATGFLDFQGRFDLELDSIFDLRPVLMFIPKTTGIKSLDGRAQLICSIRGTFDAPEIDGIAEVNHASVLVETYPDQVTDISGNLAFSKGKIEILRSEGKVSKGTFTAQGRIDYSGIFNIENFKINVEGQNMFVHDVVESLTMTVSPRLRVSGDLLKQEVAGEILIHNALYSQELDLQQMVFNKTRTVLLPTTEPGTENGQITFDLFIKAPKNIHVKNKLADLELAANLRIQGTLVKPQLEGRVEALNGKITFGNIKYQIISAVFDFLDPLKLNPDMSIQVETNVQEYKISLRIEGNLEQFSLDMTSKPPLPKAQITRLLAAGSGGGTNGYNVVTKPIQTFVEGQIEKALDLDRITVDVEPNPEDSGTTPTLTLGKRLFKDLLLTFTTTVGGSEKAQVVEIEYQLSDNISLTARRDEKGEIDTSFTFKFKIK